MRELVTAPGSAFPGHGVMKPEQQEIERLRRELARMKAERDILKKKRRPTSPRTRYEVRVRREAPGELARIVDLRSARCFLANGFHAWLVRTPRARARSDEALGASFISSYQTYGARHV